MKILLINPPWYRFFDDELNAYPIGLCYIAGFLERNGYIAKVYNFDHKNDDTTTVTGSGMLSKYEQYLKILADMRHPIWKDVKDKISEERPDIIGISVMTPKYGAALNIAKIAKELNPGTVVVFGGVHPTIMPEETLKNEHVDYVVRGEGEQTFLELVKIIESKKSPKKVLGTSFRQERKIIHNKNMPLIHDLNSLPYPARHLLVDKETYDSNAFGKIFATRGCPYQCTFCGSNKVWSRVVRYRSPENVVDEIEYVKKTYGSTHFVFEDDSFTMDINFVKRVCDLLITRKVDIEWSCETRANLITDAMIKHMKAAGCTGIVIGVESGSPRVLKAIKKGITVEHIKNAAKIIKNNGILFSAFFMIGFPDETEDDINETIALMKDIGPFTAVLSIFTPYPDTEAYQECLKYGLIPKSIDWSKFYHQSPEMHFNRRISKERFREIVKHTERIFDEHNISQRRSLLLRHPFYTLKRIIKNRYYHPKNYLKLFTLVR